MGITYLTIIITTVVIIAVYAVIMGAWVWMLAKYKPEIKVKDDLTELLEDLDNQLNYYSYDTEENKSKNGDLPIV